jgi:MFS family permease
VNDFSDESVPIEARPDAAKAVASTRAAPAAPATSTVETRTSWVVAVAALVTMAFSFGAPWVAVVSLKTIAAEFGGARSVPALAGSLGWIGVGVGGILISRIAERVGVRATVMFGAAMICTGLAVSSLGEPWQLLVGHGLFIGLLGNGGINAPLYVYVSKWFDRRRGSALALISSGAYVAGAVWPPLFERAVATIGWRQTMWMFGLLEMAVILPLAALTLRPPPQMPRPHGAASADPPRLRVLGWPPNLVHFMLCAAAFLCCVAMALPQAHLVAFCSDLGIAPSHGAAMVTVALGSGFLSRQLWGWFSDQFGGRVTLAVGSACQASALAAFLMTQDEIGLFAVSAMFGLGFAGLVPAYVLVLRELFPASEAGWRVPMLLLFSGCGMAAGAWMGGALYDLFGYYSPAFVGAIVANLANFAIVVTLLLRQHVGPRRASASPDAGGNRLRQLTNDLQAAAGGPLR